MAAVFNAALLDQVGQVGQVNQVDQVGQVGQVDQVDPGCNGARPGLACGVASQAQSRRTAKDSLSKLSDFHNTCHTQTTPPRSAGAHLL